MHRLRSRLRDAPDDGFSLLELMMTVAIVGVIITGLTGTVLAYLKNTVATESRLTESHDIQFAAAYWQRDVASIGVRANTYDTVNDSFALEQSVGVAPACTLPSGTGTTVVTLAWSEYDSLVSTDPPTKVTVSYRYLADADGGKLIRVRCNGSTLDSTVEVAHSLAAEPAQPQCSGPGGSSCTLAGNNVPVTISLTLLVRDPDREATGVPYEVTLTGERRQT